MTSCGKHFHIVQTLSRTRSVVLIPGEKSHQRRLCCWGQNCALKPLWAVARGENSHHYNKTALFYIIIVNKNSSSSSSSSSSSFSCVTWHDVLSQRDHHRKLKKLQRSRTTKTPWKTTKNHTKTSRNIKLPRKKRDQQKSPENDERAQKS